MAQIGNVPEINAVKRHLEALKMSGIVGDWELPYENILTRLTAAIFFVTPAAGTEPSTVWKELGVHPRLKYRDNHEKQLSMLEYRVEFNEGAEL